MNRFMITVGALMASVSLAGADPVDDTLVVNGDLEIAVRAPAPAHLDGALGDEVLSGWLYRGDETRAMEMDDFDNSGMIFVEQARDSWAEADGSEGKSCASCHGEPEDMAGYARSIRNGMRPRARSARWKCRSMIAAPPAWARRNGNIPAVTW